MFRSECTQRHVTTVPQCSGQSAHRDRSRPCRSVQVRVKTETGHDRAAVFRSECTQRHVTTVPQCSGQSAHRDRSRPCRSVQVRVKTETGHDRAAVFRSECTPKQSTTVPVRVNQGHDRAAVFRSKCTQRQVTTVPQCSGQSAHRDRSRPCRSAQVKVHTETGSRPCRSVQVRVHTETGHDRAAVLRSKCTQRTGHDRAAVFRSECTPRQVTTVRQCSGQSAHRNRSRPCRSVQVRVHTETGHGGDNRILVCFFLACLTHSGPSRKNLVTANSACNLRTSSDNFFDVVVVVC